MAACRALNAMPKAPQLALTRRRKERAVTIRCFAPWRRPVRYSMCCTVPATPSIGATGGTHGQRLFQRRDGAVPGETWCGIHDLGSFGALCSAKGTNRKTDTV